jgi:hypothetical protein
MTDAEEIKALLRQVLEGQEAINTRLDVYRDALNGVGENIVWLVTNTQGLFQMFASPQFMGQMTDLLTKQGLSNARPEADGPAGEQSDGGRPEGSEVLGNAG